MKQEQVGKRTWRNGKGGEQRFDCISGEQCNRNRPLIIFLNARFDFCLPFLLFSPVFFLRYLLDVYRGNDIIMRGAVKIASTPT